MEDADFLSRLYDLTALPSNDYRYRDAAGDIIQHRANNHDWDDDWVLTDPRFELRNGTDENLLRFLAETVHPIVQRDTEASEAMVRAYNDTLRADGFELYETERFGDRPIYGWRRIRAFHAPAALPLAAAPQLANAAVLHQHLQRINRDLESDPPAAIASCKELLETLCKLVLTARQVEYSTGDDLPGLFAKVASTLSINTNSVPEDRRGSDAIRMAMRTLATTVKSVAEARNSIGTGHGAEQESPAKPMHARLAFNATVAVAEYIVDTWRAEDGT